jgi:hypothetical protein
MIEGCIRFNVFVIVNVGIRFIWWLGGDLIMKFAFLMYLFLSFFVFIGGIVR